MESDEDRPIYVITICLDSLDIDLEKAQMTYDAICEALTLDGANPNALFTFSPGRGSGEDNEGVGSYG